MPNIVINRLELVGKKEQVKRAIDELYTPHKARLQRLTDNKRIVCERKVDKGYEYGYFDETSGIFYYQYGDNRSVKGIPDGFKISIAESSFTFPDFNKVIPVPDVNNFSCEWARENWGTRSNAFDCESIHNNTYLFSTAWNGVPDLIHKIALLYPEVTFIYEFASDDIGYGLGSYIFKGEQITTFDIPFGSKEAYDFAFELNGYELINGEYELKLNK